MFLWGATIGHLYQWFANGDHAPGNGGGVLVYDVLIPAVMIILALRRSAWPPSRPRRPSPSESPPTQPRSSVEAFDDAEVALDAVSECGQRLLVGRTRVCGDGLFEAVELDQDGALGDSGVVCDDPAVAGEHPPAPGLDGRTASLL